jgi:hypothetical protein
MGGEGVGLGVLDEEEEVRVLDDEVVFEESHMRCNTPIAVP